MSFLKEAKPLTISGLACSADSPIFPSASTAAYRTSTDSSFKTEIRIGTADSPILLKTLVTICKRISVGVVCKVLDRWLRNSLLTFDFTGNRNLPLGFPPRTGFAAASRVAWKPVLLTSLTSFTLLILEASISVLIAWEIVPNEWVLACPIYSSAFPDLDTLEKPWKNSESILWTEFSHIGTLDKLQEL